MQNKLTWQHIFWAFTVSLVWLLIVNQEIVYRYEFLSIFGFNWFTALAWMLGLLISYSIFSFCQKRIGVWNHFSRFLLFLIIYWPLLILAETVGYYWLGIQNIAKANYAPLPICQCLHAPVWMQISYLLLGPLYFFLVNLKPSRDEKLDLVDEKNQLINRVESRFKIHHQGLWHRTVHIYLFKRTEQEINFLVHLRAKNKDLHPNKWDTRFGGHIKSGQTPIQAALEELREEIGLTLQANDLIEGEWQKRENYPNNEFTKVFFYEFKDEPKSLSFPDTEVQQVRFATAKEIMEALEKKDDHWAPKDLNGFIKVFEFIKSKIK